MTPEEAFLDYFRRMSQAAPKRILAFSGLHTGQPNGMAAGLESLLAFARLVDDPNAVILDLGAGASSFVLRSMFPNVISSDSDAEYLGYVQRCCGEAGLSTENFLVGLSELPEGDYTFYDYGGDRDRTIAPTTWRTSGAGRASSCGSTTATCVRCVPTSCGACARSSTRSGSSSSINPTGSIRTVARAA